MNIPFTQTKEYLSWHEAVGEKTFYKEFGSFVCASLIIELRVGKVLYAPYGPALVSPLAKGGLRGVETEILDYLKELAKKENCVFVRLENTKNEKDTALWGDKQNIYPGGQNLFHFFNLMQPPKKSFAKEAIFQPRVEWWLGLSEAEESIYNNIHKDHRYSIRRAEKEGIEVEIVEENLGNYFSNFWSLLKETSERDGFSLYEEDYYRAIFNSKENISENRMKKFLVFTKQEEKYLSVALIVINDKVANLVFAGSVSEKRELGFNHLMQWEAIKKSKTLACDVYNFGGIYENGYGKPGLKGVTNFKKRFGGYAQFHGDFIDLPIKKVRYFLYILRKMIY